MKYLIVIGVLILGISAHPQNDVQNLDGARQQRLVTDAIASAVEEIQWKIRDAGLDPLHVQNDTVFTVALPVPIIFSLVTTAEELLSTGLSDIRITRMNFGILSQRLTFEFTLPRIQVNLDGGKANMVFFGDNYNGEAHGEFSISNVKIAGTVNIYIGLVSGISIRSMDIDFTVGEIKSNIQASFHGYELTDYINEFLGVTVPDTLTEYRAEINELLEIVVTDYLNENVFN